MKFLTKINRGLILTSVILIVIFIYLFAQSAAEARVKPEIKDLCQKYINTEISYKMLPEKYKKENPDMPQAELNKYIDDMRKAIKAFYTDNEQSYKYVIDRNKTDLESQAKGIGVVYSYKKDITEYKAFTFEGKTVTVTILTNSVLDGPSTPGAPRESIAAQTTDTITLQETDGQWKIIYADLQQPMIQSDNGTVKYNY